MIANYVLNFCCVLSCINLKAMDIDLTSICSQKSHVSWPASDIQSSESSEGIEKLSCIRMMIWLTVYHHFYNQEVRQFQIFYHLCICSSTDKAVGEISHTQLLKISRSLIIYNHKLPTLYTS